MDRSVEQRSVTIREMRFEDYEAVMRLWTEAGLPFRPAGRDAPERVQSEMQRGETIFLLAEVDGRLAGVVLGTHDGRKGWINRLAVASHCRRQGIARRLVREAEARLEAQGIDIVAALIETPNVGSLRFFERIGYLHDPDIEYVSRRRSAQT
jgi:N-acetylglutamate synthase